MDEAETPLAKAEREKDSLTSPVQESDLAAVFADFGGEVGGVAVQAGHDVWVNVCFSLIEGAFGSTNVQTSIKLA